MSTRTQKPRKWSSFGHRSELSFTFEFLRCVHFVHDISFFGTQLLNVFGGFISCRYWLAGWMSLISKICKHVYQSHRFLCNPYRSWEFHDSIKYQCPGETVPNGRRSWRALIYTFQKKNLHISIINSIFSKIYDFQKVDLLQTSGRTIRTTPVAPKRSQSSEASNWELLPLPNATDKLRTTWRTEKKTHFPRHLVISKQKSKVNITDITIYI